MAAIGFYNGDELIDESSAGSAYLEFNLESISKEAQDLANECGCKIDAWTHDEDGETVSHTGITAQPQK